MSDNDLLQTLENADVPQPRRRLSLGSILLIAGVLVFAFVILLALIRQHQTEPTSGAAPEFGITTFDGQPFHLSDQRGHVVVVNFWASWCGPCRDEAPLLEQLWQQYRDRGVVFVGVAYADLDTDSQAFIRQYGITYPNGADIGTTISKNQYHIVGVPETFVIDQQGNVRRFYFQLLPDTGQADNDLFITVSSLQQTIDSLLAEGASSGT